jgi:hypothetical protein
LKLNKNGDLNLTNHPIINIPVYAILSHTWGEDDDEVTFKDSIETLTLERRSLDIGRFSSVQRGNSR